MLQNLYVDPICITVCKIYYNLFQYVHILYIYNTFFKKIKSLVEI